MQSAIHIGPDEKAALQLQKAELQILMLPKPTGFWLCCIDAWLKDKAIKALSAAMVVDHAMITNCVFNSQPNKRITKRKRK